LDLPPIDDALETALIVGPFGVSFAAFCSHAANFPESFGIFQYFFLVLFVVFKIFNSSISFFLHFKISVFSCFLYFAFFGQVEAPGNHCTVTAVCQLTVGPMEGQFREQRAINTHPPEAGLARLRIPPRHEAPFFNLIRSDLALNLAKNKRRLTDLPRSSSEPAKLSSETFLSERRWQFSIPSGLRTASSVNSGIDWTVSVTLLPAA
jgi:hypothetical protein